MPVRDYGGKELQNLAKVLNSGKLSVLTTGMMQRRFGAGSGADRRLFREAQAT